ncbi:MAG: hypothetical protein V3U78_00550 [Thiotrichaceae bacterium]
MDRRKLYSISLKLLTLLGVVIVMGVMINSLFPVKDPTEQVDVSSSDKKSEVAYVSMDGFVSGKMKVESWAGRPVGIIKRINPPQDFQVGNPLNSQWRSINAEYFVFYNVVGAAQCPLYLMPKGDQLKDTCSGILYDTTGQLIKGNGSSLQIPPHYFESEATLVIGQWESQQNAEKNNQEEGGEGK